MHLKIRERDHFTRPPDFALGSKEPVTKPCRYSKIVSAVKRLRYDFLPSSSERGNARRAVAGPYPHAVSAEPRIILPDCAVAR